MHPRIVWAIARKDALEIWLNKAALGGLLSPIVLSLVWLFIGKMVGTSNTNILVYNPGHSTITQVVVAAFPDAPVTQAGSAGEVTAAFDANGTHTTTRYALGLIVPADFDDRVRTGSQPPCSCVSMEPLCVRKPKP